MIALTTEELVIVTPPKCASSAVHTALRGLPGYVEILGPLPGDHAASFAEIERHTFIVPNDYRGFRAAVLVRNPYARARSLYYHALRAEGDHYRGRFANFVADRLISGRRTWWHWPASTFANFAFGPIGKTTVAPVRTEHLADDLAALGVSADFTERVNEHANSSPLPADDSTNGLVNAWAFDDFELGGYAMEGEPTATPPSPVFPAWQYGNMRPPGRKS